MWATGLALLTLSQAVVPSHSEIVVTGQMPDREAVSQFIREVTAVARGRQLARWERPVCPFVGGLPGAQGDYITATIRGVAGAVGVETAGPDCAVNLVVVFADAPGDFVAGMAERSPALFTSLTAREVRLLTESERPVRSWQAIDTYGADGRPVIRYGSLCMGTKCFFDVEVLDGAVASRVRRSTRLDVSTAFVVLDLAASDGMTLQQLSALVTMQALARLDIDRPVAPANSILNLFHAGPDGPQDFSRWDIAYLRALYASDHTRSAGEQRGQMTRLMTEALGEVPE